MDKSPNHLVSAVIPGYKNDYILETIDSVLAQTYSPVEIIVVDDGSPNNLRETLSPLIEAGKIKYVYQTNQKMAAAKNNGISHAAGEFIAFVDDDDIWTPTKIEKQVELFKDEDVGLVYTFAEEFNDQGSIPVPNFQHVARGRIFKDIFLKDFIANSSVMIRKSCLEKVSPFNTSKAYFGVDDCDLWTRITYYFSADVVPEVLTKIRAHEKRYSGNRNIMLHNDINMRKDIIRQLDVPGYYVRKYFQRIYFALGYNLRRDERLKAAGYFLKSFYYLPSVKALRAIVKLAFYR
jgi:glycosyltransferase involved in cell wall biosynthesis